MPCPRHAAIPSPTRPTPSSAAGSGGAEHAPAPDAPLPDELAARRELGRACLWSGEPARAIEALAPVHRARPWDREVQHLMLDALFALGRSADDYPWMLEPEIVPLGAPLLGEVAILLRAEAGPVTVLDLMLAVTERGYPTFTARELAAALDADGRFRLYRAGLAPECAVVTRAIA